MITIRAEMSNKHYMNIALDGMMVFNKGMCLSATPGEQKNAVILFHCDDETVAGNVKSYLQKDNRIKNFRVVEPEVVDTNTKKT